MASPPSLRSYCLREGAYCAPLFPPPRDSVSAGTGNSFLSSILIAVVVTVAFALALVLYFILASRFWPNHAAFFFPFGRGRGRRGILPGGRGAIGTVSLLPCISRGLDESLIGLIPVVTYTSPGASLIDATECAVCLGEFRQGDALRVLPKCAHAFHLPCIDKWLRAHTTCPMCRAIVVNPNLANTAMAMAIASSTRTPTTTSTTPTQPSQTSDNESTLNPTIPTLVNLKRSFSERLWMQERAKPTASSSSSSSSSNHNNDEKVLVKSRSLSMVSSWRSKGGDSNLANKNILGRAFSSTNSKNISTPSTPPNDDVPPL